MILIHLHLHLYTPSTIAYPLFGRMTGHSIPIHLFSTVYVAHSNGTFKCIPHFFLYLHPFQFDSYIRSLSIDPSSPAVRLVTDGQLPLRQSLHPEACTKDIKLPAYYWRFSDLRKEYVRHRSGDVSQALVALSEAKKLQTLAPTTPLPASINDMFTGETQSSYFYIFK